MRPVMSWLDEVAAVPAPSFVVHPREYEALCAAGEAYGFAPSATIPRERDAYPLPALSVLGGPRRPILTANVLRAAAAACEPPKPRQWTTHADAVAWPHMVIGTLGGVNVVTDADDFARLLREDLTAALLERERATEEADRRRETVARLAAEREAHEATAEAETAAFVTQLDALTDPLVRAVLDLHSIEKEWGSWWEWPRCAGCDQGCSCDAAEWPCGTVEAIATHPRHRITVPRSIRFPKEEPAHA